MLQAVNFVSDKFSEEAIDVLLRIERANGREALTSSYWKLLRLGQVCSKEAEAVGTPKQVSVFICFVLKAISFQLKFELVVPKAVTVEWLDKSRDGSPGAVLVALAKAQFVDYVRGLVADLATVDPKLVVLKEMSGVLDKFADYETYEKSFPTAATTGGADGSALAATQGDQQGDRDAGDDPVTKAISGLSKAPAAMLQFLFDVFAGTYDSCLKDLIGKRKSIAALSFVDATDDFGQALREATRLLAMHKQVIGIDSNAPPCAAPRTLKRYNSLADGDEDRHNELRKEREDAWKQAQASRKKFVIFGMCRYTRHQDIQTFYEKQASVYTHNGKVGESHRLFVLSADLFTETQEQPWAMTPTWSETAAKATAV